MGNAVTGTKIRTTINVQINILKGIIVNFLSIAIGAKNATIKEAKIKLNIVLNSKPS